MRLESVSATPYIAMPRSTAAARNQAMPLADVVQVGAAQRGSDDQHDHLERGDHQGDGEVREHDQTGGSPARPAGRGGRPLSRSMMTPMPENMQFNGMRRPTVPTAAKLM